MSIIPVQDLEGLDRIAVEQLGMKHGLPLGLLFSGGVDIETTSPVLREILDAKKSEAQAANVQDTEKQKPDTKYVRHWAVSRPWRGQWGTVVVYRSEESGKLRKAFAAGPSPERASIHMFFASLSTQNMYSTLEAEEKAQQRLRTELHENQWATYQLSGTIQETGRSGVLYILRKNRPTIAARAREGVVQPLCTLCLHPLAYYRMTWTGALPPSDEVLAHLLMIRANEHFFWRKANQHAITDTVSGMIGP